MDKLALVGVVAAIALFGGLWYYLGSRPEPASTLITNPLASQTGAQAQQEPAQAQAPAVATELNQSQSQPMPTNVTSATLHTNKGDITFAFDAKDAPATVANFIKLAQSGYYDGTKFHRVISGFMIQGGDPLTKDDSKQAQWGTGGPGYKFADENQAAHNGVGVVSMANSGPNTNGSQFFINTVDNAFLDGKYNVFAKVTAGMDVVKAIESTPTAPGDRPIEPMVVTSVELK
jgi:peptidyl-prolyl cis-trans isomerase B (cyclophilin B)